MLVWIDAPLHRSSFVRSPLIVSPSAVLAPIERKPVRTVTRSVMLSSPMEAVTV